MFLFLSILLTISRHWHSWCPGAGSAPGHQLCQWWRKSLSPYGDSRPLWVKLAPNKISIKYIVFQVSFVCWKKNWWLSHWGPVSPYGVKGFCHHWHSWCPGAEPAPGHQLCQCWLIISRICMKKNNGYIVKYTKAWVWKNTLKYLLFLKLENPPGPNGLSTPVGCPRRIDKDLVNSLAPRAVLICQRSWSTLPQLMWRRRTSARALAVAFSVCFFGLTSADSSSPG